MSVITIYPCLSSSGSFPEILLCPWPGGLESGFLSKPKPFYDSGSWEGIPALPAAVWDYGYLQPLILAQIRREVLVSRVSMLPNQTLISCSQNSPPSPTLSFITLCLLSPWRG